MGSTVAKRIAALTFGIGMLAMQSCQDAGSWSRYPAMDDIGASGDGTSTSEAVSTLAPEGCATIFRQDRPGGTDYEGPPVRGC